MDILCDYSMFLADYLQQKDLSLVLILQETIFLIYGRDQLGGCPIEHEIISSSIYEESHIN